MYVFYPQGFATTSMHPKGMGENDISNPLSLVIRSPSQPLSHPIEQGLPIMIWDIVPHHRWQMWHCSRSSPTPNMCYQLLIENVSIPMYRNSAHLWCIINFALPHAPYRDLDAYHVLANLARNNSQLIHRLSILFNCLHQLTYSPSA